MEPGSWTGSKPPRAGAGSVAVSTQTAGTLAPQDVVGVMVHGGYRGSWDSQPFPPGPMTLGFPFQSFLGSEEAAKLRRLGRSRTGAGSRSQAESSAQALPRPDPACPPLQAKRHSSLTECGTGRGSPDGPGLLRSACFSAEIIPSYDLRAKQLCWSAARPLSQPRALAAGLWRILGLGGSWVSFHIFFFPRDFPLLVLHNAVFW